MRLLFIIITLFVIPAYSQTAKIKELKLRPKAEFYNVQDSTIIFPIIIGKSEAISKVINDEIKGELVWDADKKVSLRKGLKSRIERGLINLNYEITYNDKGLLSLFIYSEGCGAHCTTDYTYFNFDLQTGKRLKSVDILSDYAISKFEQMVFRDKTDFLTKYKNEELRNLTNEDNDTASYEWAVQLVDDFCIKEIHIENFSLTKLSIEIIDPCDFPNAIKGMAPSYELKYNYQIISPFLNPKFRQRLMK
jgi:hypothetical protein